MKHPPPLLFVHGWGFDAHLWDGVIARLPGHVCATLDLGFTGHAAHPAVEKPLVIGHSMGFAWALAHLPRPWSGAIAVNAFARFTHAPGFPDGVPDRVIDRMRQQFAVAPDAVLAEFRARCGAPAHEAAGAFETAVLGPALDWLAQCDERAALATLPCPIAALAGDLDPIVPPAMSRASFVGLPLAFQPDGGHLLPHTHPDRIAKSIEALIRALP